jgi:hypothetical protein
MNYSNPSNKDFYRPVDPSRISDLGGAEPPGFLDSIGRNYDYARAGSEWAYQTFMADADEANTRKVEAAGFKLEPVFQLLTEGRNIAAAGTEFQSIMAHNSPMPGPDDRYQAVTDFQKRVSDAVTHNKEVLAKAKLVDPTIETYDEMHRKVKTGIARARTLDPRTGWFTQLAAGLIGGTAAIFSGANPYAPVEALGLAFGGVGPSTIARIGSAGVVGAALNVLPQLGGQETLSQAGVPLADRDIVMSAGLGAIFGMGGQGLSEFAMGARGRAIANDAYGFMSLAKRQYKRETFYGAGKAEADRFMARPPAGTPPAEPLPPPPPPPRQRLPSGVPEVFNQNIPKLARAANIVLDMHTATPAGRIRFAEDLDHVSRQLEVLGASVQDFSAPTRSLKESAAVIPTIKTWLGPGIGDAAPLPAMWQRRGRTVLDHAGVNEYDARQLDPGTFAKWDKATKALKEAEIELANAAKFRADALAGKTEALDRRIAELNKRVERARSATGKAAAFAEMEAAIKHHAELTTYRPGGTPPVSPTKELDHIALGQRVVALTAKRDEIFPLVERAMERADGAFGTPSAQRDAFEDFWRPGAESRINNAWRYPPGHKRPKGKKNAYEVTWLKGGKSTEQIFAERKLELPQDTHPLASEGKPPGETQIQTATRVNTLERKSIDEERADAFIKQTKDFIASLEAVTKELPVPKAAGKQPVDPLVPSMPAGMTMEDLLTSKGFSVAGERATLKEAMEDLLGDAETHAIFTSCSVRP